MDKENHSKPLTPHNPNIPSTPIHSHKHRTDSLLVAVQQQIANNKDCDLLGIILADPHLKQLNSSLQKQAEQQKKSKLLETFPLRYNNLVQTEVMYYKLDSEFKQYRLTQQQTIDEYQRQLHSLQIQLKHCEQNNAAKDQQTKQLTQQHHIQIQCLKRQSQEQVQTKEQQLDAKDTIIGQLQRRYGRLQSEQLRLTQFMEELKEESEVLRLENDRIVKQLTQKQLELERLQQMILQRQHQYSQQIEVHVCKIGSLQNEFSMRLAHKQQEYHQLEVVTQQLKTSLKQLEHQLEESVKDKFELETNLNHQAVLQQQRIDCLLSDIDILKDRMEGLEKELQDQHQNYQSRVEALNSQIESQQITIKQLKLNQELQLYQLKQQNNQAEKGKKETISQLEHTISTYRSQKIDYQHQICQLITQREASLTSLQLSSAQILNLQAAISEGASREARYERKHKQIDKMVAEFRKQLDSFNQIIAQKEDKIQSYRKEILSLRKQVKEKNIQQHQMFIQADLTKAEVSKLVIQKEQLCLQISKWKDQCCLKQGQVMSLKNLVNKQKRSVMIQTQFQGGKVEVEIESMRRELEKIRLKYQNVIQELTQTKKEFAQQLQQRQGFIQQLRKVNQELQKLNEELVSANSQLENSNQQLQRNIQKLGKDNDQLAKDNLSMKNAIDSKLDENKQFQALLDMKINELKKFYQQKIEEQGRRYRATIETLKSEMTQLYRDIDLKKSMEEEMFEEIIKINSQRKLQLADD